MQGPGQWRCVWIHRAPWRHEGKLFCARRQTAGLPPRARAPRPGRPRGCGRTTAQGQVAVPTQGLSKIAVAANGTTVPMVEKTMRQLKLSVESLGLFAPWRGVLHTRDGF